MPFALYMIGFLVFMAGVVWAAVVVGVPQQYIAIGALVLLTVAIALAVSRTRSRRPPNRNR
jgi:membrane protein implicated in regulation of membrane protease activity